MHKCQCKCRYSAARPKIHECICWCAFSQSDLYSLCTVTRIISHLHTGTEALNQTVLQYYSNIKCHNTVILFLFLSPALFVCWFVSQRPSLLPYLFFVIDGLVDCLSGIIMMMGIILLRVMIGLSAVLHP